MSSQAPETTALLLGDTRHWRAGQLESSKRERWGCSAESLLVPVALAAKLAALMPSVSFVGLVRRIVYRFGGNVPCGGHAATVLLAGGPFPVPNPVEPCNAPEMERYFAIAIAVLGAAEGILSMVGCAILSYISSRYGQRPALLLVLVAGALGNCLIPGSQYAPDQMADWVLLVGALSGLLFGPLPYAYLVNMHIVDVYVPKDRTAALSKIGGWVALATCISYALGGSITSRTGNPFIVFYAAAAIFFATSIHVVFVLPESFPKAKRDAQSPMRLEPSTDVLPKRSLLVIEPLLMLVPTPKLDDTWNWRLAWCAAHTFIFTVAYSYVSVAWLVLATFRHGVTPAGTGLFLTVVAVSGMTVLVVIVPPLVRALRPYYSQRIANPSSLPAQDVSGHNGEEPDSESNPSDNLDVHLAFASCVILAIFYLSAAASTTNRTMIFTGICIGFASMNMPTIRSLATGSVDPLKQGDALAAIEIVSNAACLLSPIVMGSILTVTIDTMSLLLFYIHLVVVLLSSGLLFFVRDANKRRKLYT